jgi:beta-N-acetylhexosaminidase
VRPPDIRREDLLRPLTLALILGCAGQRLGADEAAFFREADPWGFILFARNIKSPEQTRRLTSELRACVGRDAPVLVDQEGGRTVRLGPPRWPRFPPARAYGELARRDPALAGEIARLGGRLIAADLLAVGIDVDCAPVLDRPVADAHAVIGERAYGEDVAIIVRLGRAFAEGLMAGGVAPVIKHIPGHGRARVDSHRALPRVTTPLDELDASDFAPFRALADLSMAMTAHVVFEAVDEKRPASASPLVIEDVVRRRIGFSGLLISDDLWMDALSGSLGERAGAVLAAGCDIALCCHGAPGQMAEAAAAARPLAGLPLARAEAARADVVRDGESFDSGQARRRFDAAFDMRFAK